MGSGFMAVAFAGRTEGAIGVAGPTARGQETKESFRGMGVFLCLLPSPEGKNTGIKYGKNRALVPGKSFIPLFLATVP